MGPGHPCRTPHANRLMREGVTFTQAYTPMTHCCPARASLMTGMYPSKHGVFNNICNDAAIHRSLSPGCETFSEKLRDAGYDLAYTGKWHVSATADPKDCGWEQLRVCALGTYGRKDYEAYLDMPRVDDGPRARGELLQPGFGRRRMYGVHPKAYEDISDYHFLQSGLAKLREFAARSEPWCVFISLCGPHAPFIIPQEYAAMYDPKQIDLPTNYNDDMSARPRLYERMQRKYRQFTEDEVRESIAHYWGYCTMLDDMLGEALAALDETGQADDTLVVRLSDHGEFLGSHGLYAKGIAPFDEAYRVPYVMRWPKGIENPGRTVDEFITLCDVSPTITALAGSKPTADPSGRSLVPFLRDETPSDWPDAFYNQCNGVEIYYTQRMVRTKQYKLVHNPVDVDELYDLENDPHEMVNIAERPDMRPVLKELFGKLWLKAKEEGDYMSPYHTCSHAPFGPAFVLGRE